MPRVHKGGTAVLKTALPVRPGHSVLGEALASLKRRAIWQVLVTAPRRGREAVTAVLSATHDFRLYGPSSVFK